MNPNPSNVEQKKVRVLIADDHQIVRMGLRSLLDLHPQIEVVGEAGTGHEALAQAASTNPDVVLLDLRMPELDGLEVCRRLKAQPSSPAVLFLTSFADDQTILAAIEVGADGYMLKSLAGQNIPAAVITAAAGGTAMDPAVTRQILDAVKKSKPGEHRPEQADRMHALTPQETRVLEHVASGRSNKQIAQELQLGEGTVRNYLSAVFAKLKVESRVAAALIYTASRGR